MRLPAPFALAVALCLPRLGVAEQGTDVAAPDAASSAAQIEVARAHFQRGVSLYRSGAYDAAFAEFARAHESAPHHRILYNLAQVQAQRHDYVEALALFQRYLNEGGSNVPEPRAQEVRTEMAELRRRVSRLRVDTNVDDARLFINGLPAGALPREEPLLLNAGIHRVRVEKPGYVGAARVITLAGGEESSVSLELLAEVEIDDVAPPPAPAPPPPAPQPPPPDRAALWTSLTTAGVFTGATVAFGFLTQRANAELDAELARYPARRASVEADRARVRTFASLTDGFGLAAVVALGFSTYFYLSTGTPSDEGASPNGLRAQLGPGTSKVSWVGAF